MGDIRKETGSLRTVYHFTRTLNEFGPLPRAIFKVAKELTERNFSPFMHWGLVIDDNIFELSGNSKAIEHLFISKPLTPDEEAKFQHKEVRGKTAFSDAEILEIGPDTPSPRAASLLPISGQQLADSTDTPYDMLRRNCQDLIDKLLRAILVSDTLVVPTYKKTLQQRFGNILDVLPLESSQVKIGVLLGRVIHSS